METNGGAAPTGCYKCGRPGHWSRDCPSNPNPNPNNDTFSNKPAATSHPFKSSGGTSFSSQKQPVEKPKKVPKTRPKLTPDLLLSDDGLGFVLRHFPKAFKFRGRGHETSDLGHLLSLYSEWHSHLIPYYSFNQFVHKVEQVGGSKRVKLCINDLREKVANGGDPTELLQTPQPHENTNHEQDANDIEEPNVQHEDTMPNNGTDDFQHNIFQEIYENITDEPSRPLNDEATVADTSTQKELPSQTTNSHNIELSEELKARIEANRLKALERAAARKRASETQPL
uniref:TIMELESS-interacting protein n=1 Tax=Erigeron canadensis TaxID=72917 RepID=UPI001CB9D745|nr:TIMELESS-interacting protein [Erigeron canadensis]